jgi:hypothetical protein
LLITFSVCKNIGFNHILTLQKIFPKPERMKKALLLSFFLSCTALLKSQCVQTCSNYAVFPITFSMEPVGGDSLFLQDDDLSAPVPIGFNFSFMCSNYSSVVVGSNGFMTFDLNANDYGCCSGQFIPSGGTPNNMVAFSWDDLIPPNGGSITYTTIGVSPNQVFILTYSNIPLCCGNSPVNTGQIKLFQADNSIEIHSALISNDGSNVTQGIEDSTATIAVAAPGANGALYTTTNTAYRWTNSIPTPPAAISGPTAICSGLANNYSVAPSPGATSYSWALPGGWTGTSTTNVISATAGSAGTLSVSATYSCGTSLPSTIAISVIAGPSVSIDGNTMSICPGSVINLSASGADTYSWSTGAQTSTIAPTPTTSTAYTVTGTSTLTNCRAIAVTSVSVYPLPQVSTAGSGSLCNGQTAALAANGAVTYTWQPGNLNGFLVNVSPTVSTVYTVTGTSSEGCNNTATASILVTSCVGLKTNAADNAGLSVYPNPNHGQFTVEMKNGMNKVIEVTDISGKVISVTVTYDDVTNVDISKYENGIYFVRVQSGDRKEFVKLIKQ